jgi:hypothetical protein
MIILMLFIINSCKDDNDDPSLSISATELSFDNAGGSKSLTLTSNVIWKATVNEEATWCTITPSGGNKNSDGNLAVSVTPYTDAGAARTAIITFTTTDLVPQVVTVTQTSPDPTFEITPTSLDFEGDGGDKTFSITSNMSWTVEVEAGKTWCNVNSGAGSGSATVTVTADFASVGEDRSATITVKPGVEGIANKTVTVSQTANRAVLTLSTNALNFAGEGEVLPLAITSNVPWTATVNETDQSWCTINPVSAESSVNATVTVGATGINQPRSTTITFTAEGIDPVILVVEQAALTPKFEISASSLGFMTSGGTGTLTITSNVPWTAAVEVGKGWCTLSENSGDGSTEITVTVTSMNDMDKAVITFTPEASLPTSNVTVSVGKLITLAAANVTSNNQPSAGYSALFDGGGGVGGHYQSQWRDPANINGVDYPLPPMPHWLVFDLGNNISAFRFQYWTSASQANSKPAEFEVFISADNTNWTLLKTYISKELPVTGLGEQFDSDVFSSAALFRYVKLSFSKTIVNNAVSESGPVCIGEMKFYEMPQ